jgi:guanylate kinase
MPHTLNKNSIRRRGLLLTMTAPTAVGKTTIANRILAMEPNLKRSISMTTRAPRPNEVDGVDYHFISEARFRELLDAEQFLEHAEVHGNLYGTPRMAVEQMLAEGKDVLFVIEWQGAQQIAEKMRQDLVSVFILPPSADEMNRRIRARGHDDEASIKRRLETALGEIDHAGEFGYVIINDDLERAVQQVHSVLLAERQRRRRQMGLTEFVMDVKANLKALLT